MSYFLHEDDIPDAEFSWLQESEASYPWDPWKYQSR